MPNSAETSTLLEEAQTFLESMAADSRAKKGLEKAGGVELRLNQVAASIKSTGTYVHTPAELQFGARLAWRNSNRCIGRHLWRSLEVKDCRASHTSDDPTQAVRQALESHLDKAFNGGRIRSVISIFSPRQADGSDPVRIGNHQLTRYAGFRSANGQVIGDPHSLELTDKCLAAGWRPLSKTPFTALPWQFIIENKRTAVMDVFSEDPSRLKEVKISHPNEPEFSCLNLRWYAVPLLADMALKIGGVVYPFAPFNGFYMGTEIGARNLADRDRYNVLPDVARIFQLETSNNRTLWRDRALVELNRAVLHSFDKAGITIGDHHKLGEQFEAFCKAEEKTGKEVSGDWSWLNPPMSPSQTPQFHREFKNKVERHTNFFYQPEPEALVKPPSGCPFHL
jgi:nitric-oxide synthase